MSKGALLFDKSLTKERQGRDDKIVHKLAGTKGKDIPKGEVQKDMKCHGFGWNRWSRDWSKVMPSLKALPIR